MSRARLYLATALALIALPLETAFADGIRVAIGELRGPGVARTIGALEETLEEHGHELVPSSEVDAAVRRHGRNRWVRVMAEVEADVLLVGRVQKSGRNVRYDVRAIVRGRGTRRVRVAGEGPGGAAERLVARLEVITPGGRDEEEPAEGSEAEPEEDGAGFSELDPVAQRSEPAAEERPASERRRARETQRRREPDADDDRGPIFETFVGGGTLMRRLVYTDDIFDRLASYSLGAAPTIEVGGRLHPFATLDVPGLRDLGVEVGTTASRVQGSERDGELTHRTSTHSLWFAGRYRLPLGSHEVTAAVGLARRTFQFEPSGPANPGNDPLPGVPGVKYRMVLFELGTRLALGRHVRVEGSARYLLTRDAGGISSELWFPRAEVKSFGARLAIDVRLADALWLSVRAAVERHAFTMNPERGDRWIAGGAVDLYVTPTLGLVVQY